LLFTVAVATEIRSPSLKCNAIGLLLLLLAGERRRASPLGVEAKATQRCRMRMRSIYHMDVRPHVLYYVVYTASRQQTGEIVLERQGEPEGGRDPGSALLHPADWNWNGNGNGDGNGSFSISHGPAGMWT
jgi:hypothetical protein